MYAKVLSLSILPHGLEARANPALAVARLGVIGFYGLFDRNALGVLAPAAMVLPALK